MSGDQVPAVDKRPGLPDPDVMRRNGTSIETVSPLELAAFFEELAFGPRSLKVATEEVTRQYSLGPRGAWMLFLLSTGIVYPIDIASHFSVAKSLITSELNRLTEAGLITSSQSDDDKRRTMITLTQAGRQAGESVWQKLVGLAHDRLALVSREDFLFCTKVLQAFSGRDPARAVRRAGKSVADKA